jgi:hypothetical protein
MLTQPGSPKQVFTCVAHFWKRQTSQVENMVAVGHCDAHEVAAQLLSSEASEMAPGFALEHVCWHPSSPCEQEARQVTSDPQAGSAMHAQ